MPAYNFKKQFADKVESGQKRQTIRQTDKGAKVGQTAYLYTGQRTKQCRKLGDGTITRISQIKIDSVIFGETLYYAQIWHGRKNSTLISGIELDLFADLDGFQSGAEMVEWFGKQYGLPFYGFLHEWTLNKP